MLELPVFLGRVSFLGTLAKASFFKESFLFFVSFAAAALASSCSNLQPQNLPKSFGQASSLDLAQVLVRFLLLSSLQLRQGQASKAKLWYCYWQDSVVKVGLQKPLWMFGQHLFQQVHSRLRNIQVSVTIIVCIVSMQVAIIFPGLQLGLSSSLGAFG